MNTTPETKYTQIVQYRARPAAHVGGSCMEVTRTSS